jgi:hypothetical protein
MPWCGLLFIRCKTATNESVACQGVVDAVNLLVWVVHWVDGDLAL